MAEYIDKELVLSKSQNDYLEKRYDYDDFVLVSDIESIPPADVRPVVRGEWERKHDNVCYWSECSNCGEYPPKNRYGQEWLSDFCPNCGADMRTGGDA